MSFSYNNDKQFLIYQLKWMGIYIAMGAVIALILPFTVSLLVALGAFFLLNFIRTRRMLKRAGIDIKGLFRSLSSSTSRNLLGSAPTMWNNV
jgi:apolipoprotein N-acyltransferase